MPDVFDNNLNIPGLLAGNESGYSVAINTAGSTTIIVGEPGADRVRVFRAINYGVWTQLGSAISGPAGSRFGHSVLISEYGNTIAVGAPDANSGAGLVRVYDYTDDWVQVDTDLTGTGTDHFGYSISGSDYDLDSSPTTELVISAPGGNGGKGFVRVYRYDAEGTAEWTQFGNDISNQSGTINDQFGYSLCSYLTEVEKSIVFVGCPAYDNGSGTVRPYKYNVNLNVWQPLNFNISGQNDSMFGYSLSLYDTLLAIGSPGNDTVSIVTYSQSDYIFFYANGGIIQGSTGEQFGASISINGNNNEKSKGDKVIAVGCPAYSNGKGRTILFGYVNNAWEQIGNPIEGLSESEQSGYSVSINSRIQFATGAPFASSDTGLTRVFQWDRDAQGFTQYISDILPEPEPELVADICFPKGTPIETDQGPVDIDLIDPKVHTMNQGDRIIAVTRTLSHDPWLVRIPKGLLGNGLPTRDTVISKNHKVMHEGRATRAIDLEGIAKTPYNPGDTLYNLLLEYHSGMMVNGLLVETLDPDDIVAQVFKVKDTPLYNTYVKMLNDRRIMINSSSGTK